MIDEIVNLVVNLIQKNYRKMEENRKHFKEEIINKIDEFIEIYSEEIKKIKEEIDIEGK